MSVNLNFSKVAYKAISAIAAFSILVLLNGCSAKGPQFVEFKKSSDVNKGKLYIYRPSLLSLGGIDYDVNIYSSATGNQKFSSIVNGSFKELELTPGSNKIRLQPNGLFGIAALSTNAITLNAIAGEVYCIKYKAPDISLDTPFKQPKIEIVDYEKCKVEILETQQAQ